MSLLMDALRKAEEAKKKAELEGKSKPIPADTAADAVDEPLDIEIEFDHPPEFQLLSKDYAASDAVTPAPAASGREYPEQLLETAEERVIEDAEAELEEEAVEGAAEDVEASDAETAADAGAENEQDAVPWLAPELELESEEEADEEADEEAEPVPPSSPRQTPDYTRPATAVAPKAAASGVRANYLAESKPIIPETSDAKVRPAGRDTYSIDFEPAKPAPVPPEPVSKAAPRDSITQRIRAEQLPKADAETVDTSMEEQDRKSARSVFAAKRSASPLKKNLQLTALSIAAVLCVAIGIYFYIGLRTGGGISIPLTDQDYQQAQRQFTDAELEMADAELGIVIAGNAITDSVPAVSAEPDNIASPPSDSAATTTDQVRVDADNIAGAAAQANPATVVTRTPVETAAASPAPAPPAVAPAVSIPPVTNTSATSTTAAVPVNSTPSSADSSNRDSAASAVVASAAASLQPQRIEPEALVSFTRRATTPAGNLLIENAYSAYQSGNLEQAERLYREALVSAPLSRSALLGLAAIAANRNDTVAALELYSRLLARDPTDPVAKAGILDIMPSGNLQQQEAELRRLQNQHPDIAPLAYAFGNFLASQQRWSEAQQAYFSALQLAKNDAQGSTVNPDYAFNLAVSLEHLGQARAAGNYYREALTLAESHPAGFNLAMARQRLGSMGSTGNE